MILSHDALMKRVHDTKALSLWNSKTGPIFWYTAGVPGPFFVNTEYLIGADEANGLVATITDILEGEPDPAIRAARIKQSVMDAYAKNDAYKNIIETLAAKAKKSLRPNAYTLVSGGERRDWLFSVPFAEETGLRHVYIFKDRSTYCDSPLGPDEQALHISDLINNAASYTDKWLPALETAGIAIDTTLCVTIRGKVGTDKLTQRGVRSIALYTIDLPFFENLVAQGLVEHATYDELALYFDSPTAWAEKYLMGRETLFDVANAQGKALDRIQSFFTKDPWKFQDRYPAFFKSIKMAIEARQKAA
jgi:hypothetical protein